MDEQSLRELITRVVAEVTAELNGTNGQPAATGARSTGSTETSRSSAGSSIATAAGIRMHEVGIMQQGHDPKEVVIGVSPAFATDINETIIGIPHGDVIREICAGIEEQGMNYRLMKVYKTADVSFIGHLAAKLSGSGIGIGIQSRGTSVIHQKDLPPLSNLELFPQAPLIDLETFRAMGRNAALYAKGDVPNPVPMRNDQMARPTYQAKSALLHNKETRLTDLHKKPQSLTLEYT